MVSFGMAFSQLSLHYSIHDQRRRRAYQKALFMAYWKHEVRQASDYQSYCGSCLAWHLH
jgi:hypothetical protein